MIIERYPNGTREIPYPHKVFHWERVRWDAEPTLSVEVDPEEDAPSIPGWRCFFNSFFGFDRSQTYSYRPV